MSQFKKIINLLESAGVTQQVIAKEVKSSQSNISGIKSGHVKLPNYEVGNLIINLAIKKGLICKCPTCQHDIAL